MKETHKELITDILAASEKTHRSNVDLSDVESFEGFMKFLYSCGFEKITLEGYDEPPYHDFSIFWYLMDLEDEEKRSNASLITINIGGGKEINNER